ncbi:hypothetical protein SS50377_25460 [Spironucleus salmonicida]|uniref:Uncharacterized protein n=1 Tax=Spironucleus salmonicida TaxID=348837 RepID=V6LKW6_9EUKA|nr:hypothetical protein SS50377_25460 [Spironucleus salmonicida]|eukprot:EST45008.1 hypothetical protein SS50377_15027 [Spironucleus salmonicida]
MILNSSQQKIQTLDEIQSQQTCQAIILCQNLIISGYSQSPFPAVLYLDLSLNCLKNLYKLDITFPNLQVLKVSGNNLVEFSGNNFKYLKYLDLSKNQIKSCYKIPKTCIYINLANNLLDEFILVSNVVIQVDLSNNKLKLIQISSDSLLSIDISYNQFESVNQLVCLLHSSQLEYIKVNNNQFSIFSDYEILELYAQFVGQSQIDFPYSQLICTFNSVLNVVIRQDSSIDKRINISQMEQKQSGFVSKIGEYEVSNFLFDYDKNLKYKHRKQSILPEIDTILKFPSEIQLCNSKDSEQDQTYDKRFLFPQPQIIFHEWNLWKDNQSCPLPQQAYLQIIPHANVKNETLQKLSEKINWANKNEKFKEQLELYLIQLNQLYTFQFYGINIFNMNESVNCDNVLQMQPILSRIMEINPNYFSLPRIMLQDNIIQPQRLDRFNINTDESFFYISKLEFYNCDLDFMNFSENQDLSQCVKYLKLVDCGLKQPNHLLFLSYFQAIEHLVIIDEVIKDGFNHSLGAAISCCHSLQTFNGEKFENLYQTEILNCNVQERIISKILNKKFEQVNLPYVNTAIFD